jgi:hypothetical protein
LHACPTCPSGWSCSDQQSIILLEFVYFTYQEIEGEEHGLGTRCRNEHIASWKVKSNSWEKQQMQAHSKQFWLLTYYSLQGFGVKLIAGTGAVASLQGPASAYLRIRAFAQPALLVIIVTQASLLAQKDSWSPALAVMAQVVVNFTLDVALIVFCGAGVAGAAWATVAAQYLGAVLLVQRLYAAGRVRFQPQLGNAWQQARPLAAVLAPLVVVYVSRNLCYLLLQVCCYLLYC